MGKDDPVEEPFVRAVVVPGDVEGTEAVDVFIAWDDVDEIAQTARDLLPSLRTSLATEPRFGGRVRFVVPTDFVGEGPEVQAALDRMRDDLAASVAGELTASGAPWRIEVQLGLR